MTSCTVRVKDGKRGAGPHRVQCAAGQPPGSRQEEGVGSNLHQGTCLSPPQVCVITAPRSCN